MTEKRDSGDPLSDMSMTVGLIEQPLTAEVIGPSDSQTTMTTPSQPPATDPQENNPGPPGQPVTI